MGMTIYEIDSDIQGLLDTADQETGELSAETVDQLMALQVDRIAKIEAIALAYKNKAAEAAAIKAEKDSLQKRQASADKAAQRIKDLLQYALGGDKLITARVRVWHQSSLPKTIYEGDIADLPDEYKRIKVEPDLTAIRSALEAGKTVEGARLEQGTSLVIK